MFFVCLLEAVLIVILVFWTAKKSSLMKKLKDGLAHKTSVVESLRVVNHDYKNKMHVLMGYIETDRFDDAKQFINNARTVPTEELMRVTDVIKNPRIASLIIGKLIEAKDLGITLNVMPDSVCDYLSKGIPEKDYITVIGNLLQNSIDELEICGKEEKSIDLFINAGGRWSIISVMDNGNGIPCDEVEKIFRMGYTTKIGKNRGLGLGIVKRLAEKYNGSVDIESEENEGTEISVSIQER